MSGGAGKVYFVLYLAVVLELLIIIVERDEAEEGLLRKQRETMKIVESILSQLQSGAGTEGINTRPKDEITIPPDNVDIKEVLGTDIKSDRQYIIEVGITDISSSLKKIEGENDKEYTARLKDLVSLANVRKIEYQVFFNDSKDPSNPPAFPDEASLQVQGMDVENLVEGDILDGGDGAIWTFRASRKLVFDKEKTFDQIDLNNVNAEALHPVYPSEDIIAKGPSYVSKNMPEDSTFFYSPEESMKSVDTKGGEDMKKRSFVVNFQPPREAGWYKLRFISRTNRILGVKSNQNFKNLDEEAKVNIGTVQLTVRDLLKVKKQLLSNLDKYGLPTIDVMMGENGNEKFAKALKKAKDNAFQKAENPNEAIGKINLYSYIARLLAPGKSLDFEQNKGGIEFDVRVITPDPKVAKPTINVPAYFASFDKLAGVFDFSITPWMGDAANKVTGRVVDMNGSTAANVVVRPIELEADGSAVDVRQGRARRYTGVIDSKLEPGIYDIEMTHYLSGADESKTVKFQVFKTGLTESSKKDIDFRMGQRSYYGTNFMISAIPESGGKIKSNQFRMYLNTDKTIQSADAAPFEGLALSQTEALSLNHDANELSLRITWKHPITHEEVDIYSLNTVKVKQKSPKINTGNKSVVVSGNEKNVKVRVSGISIGTVNIGDPDPNSTKEAKTTVKLSGAKVSIDGYELNGTPTFEETDGKYSIYFELSGKLARGEDMLTGSVSVSMQATAINPLNGKASKQSKKKIKAMINFEPEKTTRRRGGGATRRRR